jgi:esterase
MQLHFRQQGHGFPLIILHGLFGSLDNWAFVSQQLSEYFQVFSVDQRNHGLSPHSSEMSYPVMAQDVNEFMDEHALPRTNLLGHSMGGKVAMQFALKYPQRVERLIIVDMAPRAYAPAHESIFRALLALKMDAFQNRAQIEDALSVDIPELATRRFLLKGLTRNSAGTFEWKFNLKSLHEDYHFLNAATESNQPFFGPTLFIRGENSDYIREQDLAAIQNLFPASRLVTIPDASHWVHAEAPEKFQRAVTEFLCETN